MMDWLTNLLTHSLLEWSSFLSNSFLAMQETPCILWNLKVHYHVHQCVTSPNPQPDESTPQSPIEFFNIHFYITFPSICRLSKCFLSFRFPHQNPLHFSSHLHVSDGLQPLITYCLMWSHNAWWVQILKHLIMQFPPVSLLLLLT